MKPLLSIELLRGTKQLLEMMLLLEKMLLRDMMILLEIKSM
jgi:hypothetical protein